jgi:hypothetical protein
MPRRFDRFIAALARTKVSDRACNQYSSIDSDLCGNAIRRRNLRRYLEEIEAIGSGMTRLVSSDWLLVTSNQ